MIVDDHSIRLAEEFYKHPQWACVLNVTVYQLHIDIIVGHEFLVHCTKDTMV